MMDAKLELGESKRFPGKTHEEMIEEMCKLMFTDEYLNCYITSEGNVRFSGTVGILEIPWLEVCMLHLPKVLSNPNDRPHDIAVRQAYHLHEFFYHPKHIVDYLYYEYQNQTIWTTKK